MTPKSYNSTLTSIYSEMIKNISLEDLASGSALQTLIDSDPVVQKTKHELRLINFLAKLDNRFKKYLGPK